KQPEVWPQQGSSKELEATLRIVESEREKPLDGSREHTSLKVAESRSPNGMAGHADARSGQDVQGERWKHARQPNDFVGRDGTVRVHKANPICVAPRFRPTDADGFGFPAIGRKCMKPRAMRPLRQCTRESFDRIPVLFEIFRVAPVVDNDDLYRWVQCRRRQEVPAQLLQE